MTRVAMSYINVWLKIKSLIASNWVLIISLVDLLGASLFMPLFGTHLRSLGMTHFNVGIINSAFHGAQLISGPIIGNWSDNYGRKSVLLFSIAICGICYCVLGFLSSFVIILSLRLILGIFKHTQSLCKALVADIMPQNEQTMSHGKLNAVTSFGFMIGPLIGGHIIEMNNGFRVVSIVACFIFLANSIIVSVFVPKKQVKTKTESKSLIFNMTTSFKELLNLNWQSCWDILLLKFLFGLCTSLYYSTYIHSIQEKFSLTQRYIGYMISFQGLMAAIFSIFAGKFNEFFNTSKIMQVFYSFLTLSLSFLVFGFAHSYLMFFLVAIFVQASNAFIRTITTKVLLERSSPEHRGSIVGMSGSIISISRLFGPLISGFVADHFDLNYNSFLSSLIAFATCMLCLSIKRSEQDKKSI